jgi:hyperosmotically inducible periplasmic protein
MKKAVLLFSLTLLILGRYAGPAYSAEVAQTPAAQTAPDNTGRNVRDRGGATLTPGDQAENAADRTLTQQIRQALVDDDSLSTTAKNIKIITANGMVMLRGPVKNVQEKGTIEAKAQHIAGADKVESQLEIMEH